LIHLSATIPIRLGIKIEEMPMVVKIAPNSVKDHFIVMVQYFPTVINHAPQTKYWRKLRTVNWSLIELFCEGKPSVSMA
jgi:hypothetical protein